MKKWIKHIVKEGSRDHVIWWDSKGSHCSVKNCEVNKPAILDSQNAKGKE